ncbi:hypothetical protein PENFLA_c044G00498 [Penicillium flavigenum]|uniref:Uncharacterized protein n=1 Tax=Penicillium flavigenum TaxID=254877 RepID=A0A1V6SIV6_9EURO|nr:hypothetical protein PENFLA_c044G00498 [Penicillium flavigenum]
MGKPSLLLIVVEIARKTTGLAIENIAKEAALVLN